MSKNPATGLTYAESGVETEAAIGALQRLVAHVGRPRHQRTDGSSIGTSVLESGFFASVLDIGGGRGLALATDGVGTKVLVAEMVRKYDTIGIDCVAMNVNDLICVGAEPLAMLDYLAVQVTDAEVFEQIGQGLAAGAQAANISIPGGEVSQMKEIIRGVHEDEGIDLVGAAVGLVDLDKLVVGAQIEAGDVVVGLHSNGLHSNGYTLARRVFFGELGLKPEDHVDEFGHSVAEELLRPTAIYVKPAVAMLRAGLRVRSFHHMTSDGFLNLLRVRAQVGYRLHTLPETQPVFDLLQKGGNVEDREMFLVYNMGIGFGIVVPPDDVDETLRIAREHGHEGLVLGEATTTDPGRVVIEPKGLVGVDDDFQPL
jgi:phosphoribosylformylglycinamidine cyclo-ligase